MNNNKENICIPVLFSVQQTCNTDAKFFGGRNT